MDPKYDIPQEDAWIIQRISNLVAERIALADHHASARRSLMRLLFGLQRLPYKTSGLSISIGHGAYIELNDECFGVTVFTEDHHTQFRLQYFDTSHHCLEWHDNLVGDEKRRMTQFRLDDLRDAFSEETVLYIEDYSTVSADVAPCILR